MKWKEFISDYLKFTRKDRIGLLVITGMSLIIFFLPKLFSGSSHSKTSVADTAWISTMKRLEQKEIKPIEKTDATDESYAYQYDRSKETYASKMQGELFFFDPNKLSATEWKKLGLRDKTINTIENYLNKGGHFRKPED